MLKTLLALSGAMLLAAPSLHAQHARSFGGEGTRAEAVSGGERSQAVGRRYAARGAYGGRYYGGGYGHGYGRYYYLGGIPYYYPFFGFGYGYGYGLGFGYPAYAYDGYWNGYAGAPYGSGYGPDVYNGRVADQGGQNDHGGQGAPDEQKGPNSLPGAVQRQLVKRGYYKGTVDGDFGPASRAALSHFQRDNHLKDTGRIDEDSLEALGFVDHR